MERVYFEYLTDYHKWRVSKDNAFEHWFVETNTDGSSFQTMMDRARAWDDIEDWCVEQFGARSARWSSAQSGTFRNYFCFRDATDATAFRIRWG